MQSLQQRQAMAGGAVLRHPAAAIASSGGGGRRRQVQLRSLHRPQQQHQLAQQQQQDVLLLMEQQQPQQLLPVLPPLPLPQQPAQRRHPHAPRRRRLVVAAADGGKSSSSGKSSSGGGGSGGGGQPSREDRADASGSSKADFSAYWSLRVREFFSKRRAYLQQARRSPEPPEALRRLDAQIRAQEDALDAARAANRRATVARAAADPALRARAVGQDRQLLADAAAARAELHRPRLKLGYLTAVRVRQLVRAALLAPLTLPAAAMARWHALFASQRYEQFLLAEGERVWAFRNRTENERWFWEVFAFDRLLIPVAWTVCYQVLTPCNLVWSVLVPLCFLGWQNGRLPGPGQLEWWLTMALGAWWKCGDQVAGLAALLFKWW